MKTNRKEFNKLIELTNELIRTEDKTRSFDIINEMEEIVVKNPQIEDEWLNYDQEDWKEHREKMLKR